MPKNGREFTCQILVIREYEVFANSKEEAAREVIGLLDPSDRLAAVASQIVCVDDADAKDKLAKAFQDDPADSWEYIVAGFDPFDMEDQGA